MKTIAVKTNKAELQLEFIKAASGAGKVKVTGLAYSGDAMDVGWGKPIVVDLAGMAIPGNIPLLVNHLNLTSYRVGLVNPTVKDDALMIDGEIVSSNEISTEIIEQLKANAEWQLSIGVAVEKYELVEEGEQEANGRTFAAPFFHITKSTLREVSVVAVGADSSTRMRVAASFHLYNAEGGRRMDYEPNKVEGQPPNGVTPTPEPEANVANVLTAERTRVSGIQDVCAGQHPEIEREAIKAGWSVEDTSRKVLKALRENRPQASPGISVSRDRGRDFDVKALEAGLCLRAGMVPEVLVREYGEQIVEAAHGNRGLSLAEIFALCAKLEGISVPRAFGNDTIRAGFSTISLPGLLGNVANKRLLRSFEAQPVVATRLCAEAELNDFKESERYRLTDVGDLEQVAPDGELKHGSLTEEKATNQLATYGKTFGITRQMIYNDDLGGFLKVPAAMGARAARKIDQLFFARLLANPTQPDTKALFHADHKNYSSGGTTALSATALAAAIQMFLDQVDSDNQPINLTPKYLLVPTGLKMTARELLNSTVLMAVGSTDKTKVPTYNGLVDEDLQVLTSPYLSNTSITGYSTTAWYLFSDPAVADTFEIGYLRGQRTPKIEQADTDFNTLGIRFRVYFDLGVREQDYRGMVKFAGA